MFKTRFGTHFEARYFKGDAYITVWCMGREIDVINISHIDAPTLTRKQFIDEVADSRAYIEDAYDIRDILMIPVG